MDMTKLYYVLALFIFGLSSIVVGQDHVFQVLVNQGNNKVESEVSGAVTPLKAGLKLGSSDKLIVSEGSYIGLVHKSGQTLEIRTSGIHPIASLESRISANTSGLSHNYMKKHVPVLINRGALQSKGTVGSDQLQRTGSFAINLLVKESKSANRVLNDRTTIRWSALDSNQAYIVIIKNVFDQILWSYETRETEFEIDFTDDKLKNERFLIVKVKSKYNESLSSRDFGFTHLSDSEGSQLLSQLSVLQEELAAQTAMGNIVYASFYEMNGLYQEALDHYMKAVALTPKVKDYQKMLRGFMIEHGLSY